MYNIDRYFTEMQRWLIDTLTFTSGEKDPRYIVITGENGEIIIEDLWLFE
jgi:hypothetical protein